MVFSLFIICLSLLSCFSEATLRTKSIAYLENEQTRKSSKNIWDPKKDAIFDPETGFCHFEDSPSHRFLPYKLEEHKTQNPLISEFNEAYFSNPNSQVAVPSASPSLQERSTLYVPEKCKSFERKWDFYLGHPEEDQQLIGWVSRIGFADNIIHELKLPTFDTSYTLLPNGYCSKVQLWKLLNDSRYIEFTCQKSHMFHNLYAISSKVDGYLRKVIIAIKLTFDSDNNLCVKIFVDTKKDLLLQEDVYAQLYTLYPLISNYNYY